MRVDVKYAVYPSPVEVEVARAALTHVQAALKGAEVTVRLEDLDLPRSAVEVLGRALGQLAEGRGVTVLDPATELTTQQAADLLNVSRPYLIKLLDAGEIEYRLVGKHRRIAAAALLAYKEVDLARRHAALDELTALSEEMGLY